MAEVGQADRREPGYRTWVHLDEAGGNLALVFGDALIAGPACPPESSSRSCSER
jgi:hypothetical protein